MTKRSSGGVLVLGFFGAMLMAGCGSDDSAYTSGSSGGLASQFAPAATPPTIPTSADSSVFAEVLYLHDAMNIRSEPRKDASLVRAVERGQTVRLGPVDGNGWARAYESYGSAPIGYLYRASDNVRTDAPDAAPPASSVSASSSRRSSAGSRGYHTGPRGGCYTYTASGNKRYVDRSNCR